jgi:hypothetical protein
MWGWLAVLAAGAGIAAVVRWYGKADVFGAYSAKDRETVDRIRAQKLHSGGHSHGGN